MGQFANALQTSCTMQCTAHWQPEDNMYWPIVISCPVLSSLDHWRWCQQPYTSHPNWPWRQSTQPIDGGTKDHTHNTHIQLHNMGQYLPAGGKTGRVRPCSTADQHSKIHNITRRSQSHESTLETNSLASAVQCRSGSLHATLAEVRHSPHNLIPHNRSDPSNKGNQLSLHNVNSHA